MRFHYDSEADGLDITLREGIVARTVEVDLGTLVDLDETGTTLNIEVIHPARAWPLDAVLERFPIDDADAAVLRSLWAENKPYPSAELALTA
jgi:uncharacterized protein YuzE